MTTENQDAANLLAAAGRAGSSGATPPAEGAAPAVQQQPEPGVSYVQAKVVMPDSSIADLPLLRPAPAFSGSLGPPEGCADIDIVMSRYLEKCGWKLSPHDVATPARVLIFLVRQLGYVQRQEQLWARLVGRSIDDAIAKNPYWKVTLVPQTGISFHPHFWLNLFRSLECHINPEFFKCNPCLAEFAKKASEFGANPETRILPFALLRALVGRNLMTVASDRKMQKYLFGVHVWQTRLHSLCGSISDIAVGDANSAAAHEDAWILLLASTTFRKIPLVKKAFDFDKIPVLTSTLDESRRQAVLAEEEAMRAERERDAAMSIGCPCDDAPVAAPATCGGGSASSAADIPVLAPVMIQSAALVPAASNLPALVMRREPPAYAPFPSSKDERPEDIIARFSQIATPTASGAKAKFIAGIGSNDMFAPLFTKYCAASGFNAFADPALLLRSLALCFVGGDHWVAVHKALLPDLGDITNPRAMREVVGSLTLAQLIALFDLANNENVGLMPTDVSEVLQLFSMMIGSSLRYDVKSEWKKLAIKMMLVMYYVPWSEAPNTRIDSVHIWSSADGYLWSYDDHVEDIIEQWKRGNPTLPSAIRAYALKLMFSTP